MFNMAVAIIGTEKSTKNNPGREVVIAGGFSSIREAQAEAKEEQFDRLGYYGIRFYEYTSEAELAQNVARYEQAHPAQGNDPDDKQRVLEVERLAEQAIEKANQGIPVSLAERESFSRVTRGKKLEDEYQKATGVPFYQDFNAPATEMEGSIEFNLQRQRQLSEQKAQEVA